MDPISEPATPLAPQPTETQPTSASVAHAGSDNLSKRMFSGAENAEMVHRYGEGTAAKTLALEYSVSTTTISRLLKRNGVKMRPLSVSRKTHTINESVFDSITDDSAYWAGFLMADGCVSDTQAQSSHRIIIGLSRVDILHLEKFKNFLNTTYPVSNYTNNHSSLCCKISVQSNHIAMALKDLGVTPRKSLNAKALCGLEKNRHFWRGAVDGDGSIFLAAGSLPTLSFCGSRHLVEQFADFCRTLTKTSATVRKSKTIYEFKVAGTKALPVICALYQDSQTALARKQVLANKILGGDSVQRVP